MDKIKNTRSFMRIVHRYLGYFMAGIMTVYAVSGVLLVYRDTDLLKKEKHYDKVLPMSLNEEALGKELKIKNFKQEKVENGLVFFKEGTYEPASGRAKYTKKELPYLLDKMTKLHKSPSKDKLGGLNVLFGVTLFFFVVSSFWMFNPKTKVFKRGMIYAVAGFVISVILLLI